MGVSFNLIDEPFIPCVMPDGTTEERNLRDALVNAPDAREIRDDSPLVTAALHRFLLAILHRNFGPKNLDAWKTLWQAGCFDSAVLDRYFEQWRERFDLFHPRWPFYQTSELCTDKPLSVAALFEELARGNNATLFDHTTDGKNEGVTPAAAARGLIAQQGFALGFGVSPDVTIRGQTMKTGNRKDGPLARGILLLVQGESLFQTLMLNLTQYSPCDDDLPIWERESPESVVDATNPFGRVDLYTFQCRRLRLEPPEAPSEMVDWVHYAQGRKLADGELDPMKPYRRDKKSGWVVFSLKEERALWRDSATLLDLANNPDRPILALNWVSHAIGDRSVPPDAKYQIDAFGMGTQPGKATSVIFWRHEHMPLPLAYLTDADLVHSLKTALQLAEDVAQCLSNAAKITVKETLAPDPDRKPDAERVQDMVNSLAPERFYWSRLEAPFYGFLKDLASGHEPGSPQNQDHRAQKLRQWFTQTLKTTATDAFDHTVGRLDRSARVLRAVVKGRQSMAIQLAKLAHKYNLTEEVAAEEAVHA